MNNLQPIKYQVNYDVVNQQPVIVIDFLSNSETPEVNLLKDYIERALPDFDITPIVEERSNGVTRFTLSLVPFDDLVVTDPLLITAITNNVIATSLSNQNVTSIAGLAIAAEVNKFTHIQDARYRFEGSEPTLFNFLGSIRLSSTTSSGQDMNLHYRNLTTNQNTLIDSVFVPNPPSYAVIIFAFQQTLNPGDIFTLGISKDTNGGGVVTVESMNLVATKITV